MLLKSVDFIADWLLILLVLVQSDFKFLQFKTGILSIDILELISFEQLRLGSLVLFVLIFEVTQFTVQFVQSIFKFLNLLVGFTDLEGGPANALFLIIQQISNTCKSTLIIINLNS